MKIMLIGRTGSGKTTLMQRLNKYNVSYKKTQMVSYEKNIIDTPGEYLENKFYYKALLVASAQAQKIIFIQDATASTTLYPPNFKSMFAGKEVIGVVTKRDLCEDSKKARDFLSLAGANDIYEIGIEDDENFCDLKRRIGLYE